MPLYSPTTHLEGIRSPERILRFFSRDAANSIVKVNDIFTSVRQPSAELLDGLTEGTDYFRGGYVYELSSDLITELTNAGFPSSI